MSGEATFGSDARVLVIGLGRSGLASCAVLRARGASVWATDEKDPSQLAEAIGTISKSGGAFVTPDALELILGGISVAVLSPGIPLTSPLVVRIQAAGVPVYSEIEVAYRLCAAPIVAITGTKGKTTTTALIGAMFRKAGKTTHVGGNIGNALIGEVEKAGPEDWVVAEVSSFQLESIRSFKPRISLITNLSPDHLDRYHSMDEYTEAKFRIFANQGRGDTFIGNADDPAIAVLAEGEAAHRMHCRALWFGREPGKHTTLYRRNDRITYAPPAGDPRLIEIMPVEEIPLLGAHNIENVSAALLVGLAAGFDPEALRAAVREFTALPHRLQTVGEQGGVLYVDDSKATNPSSVVAALEAFSRPVVLIAGGKSKRTDFSGFAPAVRKHTKAVVLIGEATAEIARAIKGAKIVQAGSMEEAVDTARRLAAPGDVVLLSPGCASFDMFTSAEDRGNAFIAAVRAGAVKATADA
jgi:UDP-N-acetylmuramoylalanine--D-glutamate ligase